MQIKKVYYSFSKINLKSQTCTHSGKILLQGQNLDQPQTALQYQMLKKNEKSTEF